MSEHSKSNAARVRLNAAAPDLLEALEHLLIEVQARDINAPVRIRLAKMAIEKATGVRP